MAYELYLTQRMNVQQYNMLVTVKRVTSITFIHLCHIFETSKA